MEQTGANVRHYTSEQGMPQLPYSSRTRRHPARVDRQCAGVGKGEIGAIMAEMDA